MSVCISCLSSSPSVSALSPPPPAKVGALTAEAGAKVQGNVMKGMKGIRGRLTLSENVSGSTYLSHLCRCPACAHRGPSLKTQVAIVTVVLWWVE